MSSQNGARKVNFYGDFKEVKIMFVKWETNGEKFQKIRKKLHK